MSIQLVVEPEPYQLSRLCVYDGISTCLDLPPYDSLTGIHAIDLYRTKHELACASLAVMVHSLVLASPSGGGGIPENLRYVARQ